MKQFWTPLARILGMVEPETSRAPPTDAPQDANRPHNHRSQWPLLFNALRQEAEQVWCAKNLKHAEVNPDEILAVTAISLQAGNPAMDEQLRSWYAETDEAHLIQWMVNGPFNTAHILEHVNFDAFTSLHVSKRPEDTTAQAPSAYSPEGLQATQAVFHISTQTRWMPRPPPPVVTPECQALDILVKDAHGERRVRVHHPLVFLGSSVMPDSHAVDTSQNPSVSNMLWQGESAKFIHVQAVHASGLHLMLRSHAQGFEVQDIGSTNGTFIHGENLPLLHTLSSVLPVSLGLGGPTTDPADMSACVQISMVGMPVSKQQPTPLRRVQAEPPALPVISLWVMDGAQEMRVPVNSFPFEIGRDPQADWTVPAEHAMVSRRHLILQSFDPISQRVDILDVSRHGLTVSPEGFASPPKSGTWVNNGQTLILGRIEAYAGISFRLECGQSTTPLN